MRDGASRTRVGMVGLLMVAVFIAGCLTPPPEDRALGPIVLGTPSGQTLGTGEFWMVWVQGEEREDPGPNYNCDYPRDHRVYPEEKRLEYNRYEVDLEEVRSVIAFDLEKPPTACPVVHDLVTGFGGVNKELGMYGELHLIPQPDGKVLLDAETWLHPGQDAFYLYTGEYEDNRGEVDLIGEIKVRHLGAWSRDQAIPKPMP